MLQRVCASSAFWCCIFLFGLGATRAFAIKGDLDSADARLLRGDAAIEAGKFSVAFQDYNGVLEAIRTLDIDVREWFQGNASIGIAFCAAATSDTAGTRHWIDEALSHHYWMFGALRIDPILENVAGKDFIDSICHFWNREREEKRANWRTWDPIVLQPKECGPVRSRTTIIALHGGYENLREFSSHWQEVADSLCAVVIIPPGTDRVSPVGFSWGFDMAPIDSAFKELLARPSIRSLLDTQHLYLAGFSQGGHAALGLALRHPDLIRGAIVIEGFHHDPVDRTTLSSVKFYGTHFYGIYGSLGYKPFMESFVRFKQSCDSIGIPVQLDVIENMVHELPPDLSARMKKALQWFGE